MVWTLFIEPTQPIEGVTEKLAVGGDPIQIVWLAGFDWQPFETVRVTVYRLAVEKVAVNVEEVKEPLTIEYPVLGEITHEYDNVVTHWSDWLTYDVVCDVDVNDKVELTQLLLLGVTVKLAVG